LTRTGRDCRIAHHREARNARRDLLHEFQPFAREGIFECGKSGRVERGLGEHWTPDVAAAWTAAYTILSDFMIGEAYGHNIAAE
jgi:hypothetical protein